MKNKITLMWPTQSILVESLFRHYNGLAETAGYLDDVSQVLKPNDIKLSIHDCAVKSYTAKSIAQIVYDNDLIFLCINMNNIEDAIKCAKFLKSIDKNVKLIAYGEGVCCRPSYFSSLNLFDYVLSSGQYELGIEIILMKEYKVNKKYIHSALRYSQSYYIEDSIVYLSKETSLPPSDWGVPKLSKLPLENYIDLSDGELHITACKGCPFNCEFCNEKHVATNRLQYRDIDQLVDYLNDNKKLFKSAYLDSSTFTFNKRWVIEFCEKLSKSDDVLPWKTCTRLDCLDEEVIRHMAKANCKRISIGVESISNKIQKRNNKVIDFQKLEEFKEICLANNILPRLLLIIGLNDQTYEEIKETHEVFYNKGFDVRFRIYQDFNFLLEDNLELIDNKKLEGINRICVPEHIDSQHINYYRQLEYPNNK